MTDPITPGDTPVDTAHLEWTDQGLPLSTQFDDLYFSRDSGIEESRYVFLQHNNLAERFAKASHVTIGETGFGTGLNFLCAWQLRDQLQSNCALRFISVEKYPLTLADLTRALALWPELKVYARQLLRHYPKHLIGWHKIEIAEAKVELLIYFGEALQGFQETDTKVDAWFLDGFAPAKNPQMWTPQLFKQIARLSYPGTRFATFTAAGAVRQGLADAGFSVQKVKGFGRKRHMLTGIM